MRRCRESLIVFHMKHDPLRQLVHHISFHPRERLATFLSLSIPEQAEMLRHASKHIRADILAKLPNDAVVALLSYLDPDDATDLARLLLPHRRAEVVRNLNESLQRDLTVLTSFDPDTAAGMMNTDYVQVLSTNTIAEAAERFKVHESRTGRPPTILVMKEGKLLGYLPGHALGVAMPKDHIERYVKHVSTVVHDADHSAVIDLFRSHPHDKAVVLGVRGNVVGIIFADDVLDALKERETAALYNFAGIHAEESVTDPMSVKVKHRYKWLIINLGTAFFASFVVSQFQDVISQFVLLAVYMPIVAGMGGNAATQTLAVMVRGIALRKIDLPHAWKVMRREVGAGMVNGFINGLIVATVVIVMNRDFKIAFILAFAMMANLIVAACFGTIVPLIMQRLGKDPAASATIFITTATDVLGFLVFLGLAQAILL